MSTLELALWLVAGLGLCSPVFLAVMWLQDVIWPDRAARRYERNTLSHALRKNGLDSH